MSLGTLEEDGHQCPYPRQIYARSADAVGATVSGNLSEERSVENYHFLSFISRGADQPAIFESFRIKKHKGTLFFYGFVRGS